MIKVIKLYDLKIYNKENLIIEIIEYFETLIDSELIKRDKSIVAEIQKFIEVPLNY